MLRTRFSNALVVAGALAVGLSSTLSLVAAGPPERTSSFTPVSLPFESTSVPLTYFLSAFTV